MSLDADRAWRRVLNVADLVEGRITRREVESSHGRPKPTIVALTLIRGDLHAFEDSCPHAGWPLSDGDFDGCVVTCARHYWEFDVVSGESRPGGWPLRKLSTQVDDDGEVMVDVFRPLYQR